MPTVTKYYQQRSVTFFRVWRAAAAPWAGDGERWVSAGAPESGRTCPRSSQRLRILMAATAEEQEQMELAMALSLSQAAVVSRVPAAEDAPLLEWERPDFLHVERERYRERAQAEHGLIQNPITGDELDIMEQCVNLRLSANGEAKVDTEAYREVLRSFMEELPLHTLVWFDRKGTGRMQQRARVVRVNRENGENSYDLSFTVPAAGQKEKVLTKKDVERRALATAPLLVVGEPAAGKTTFSKQLLTFIMRSDDCAHIVPVMIRVVDLVRNLAQITAVAAAMGEGGAESQDLISMCVRGKLNACD